ncbi:MAG: heme A synthase [Gemmatimonadetes bacterium]|nr:heme A synthase [Gemmatimonadota bacterium]
MATPQHHRAFFISAIWTLGLLFLGSVVHATESSLACPDWPTCFGTMVPEMTGGVFWEHLHRLVAGGLILFFSGAVYLTWKEKPHYPWVMTAAWLGLALLLVQAVFGGVTVLLLLPDAISTSHLGLAFMFLALTTVLAVVSSPAWKRGPGPPDGVRPLLRKATMAAAVLTFAQSLVGAAVRHTDAGMACPDVPLCLGAWVPPLSNHMVALHFSHRVLGLAVLATVLWAGHVAFWNGEKTIIKRLGLAASLLAGGQVLLGFLSVFYRLAVVPVSLHTLLAASLLTALVVLATLTWAPKEPSWAPKEPSWAPKEPS